jgi:hypothetical protein
MHPRAQSLIADLDLQPHPEGGYLPGQHASAWPFFRQRCSAHPRRPGRRVAGSASPGGSTPYWDAMSGRVSISAISVWRRMMRKCAVSLFSRVRGLLVTCEALWWLIKSVRPELVEGAVR